MKWKPTLFLFLAAIGVGAYVSFIELRWLTPEQADRQQRHIFSVAPEAVHQIRLPHIDPPIKLNRQGERWIFENVGRANPALLSDILKYTSSLMAQRAIPLTETEGREDQFGLTANATAVELHTRSEAYLLRFGKPTALGTSRYVQSGNDPQIYVLGSGLFELIDQSPESFRDPRVIRADAAKLKFLSIESGATKITLRQESGQWELTHPFADTGDPAILAQWIAKLNELSISEYVPLLPQSRGEEMERLGLNPPAGVVHLSFQDRVDPVLFSIGQALEANNETRYVSRSDEPWAYAVDAKTAAELLVAQPDAVRLSHVFDFFDGEVEKIEMTANGRTWHIERHQNVWVSPDSEDTLDADSVRSFVQVLGEMGIESFTDPREEFVPAHYGLDQPSGIIKVWLSNTFDPQILTVGQDLLKGTKHWGYLEPRNTVVELPPMIEHLLLFTPKDFRELPPPKKEKSAADSDSNL